MFGIITGLFGLKELPTDNYLSMESALSHYGLIPEKVFTVTSMTTKASRKFETNIGLYTFTNLPLPYYAFGLTMVSFSKDQKAMVASTEEQHQLSISEIRNHMERTCIGRDYPAERVKGSSKY